LVNRGDTYLALQQKASAIADWTAVFESESGASVEEGGSIAAEKLFCLYWSDGFINEANSTLDRFAQHLATLPEKQKVLGYTEFLARLASPSMRQGWTYATRRLLKTQSLEDSHTLDFLEPVCRVLENSEKSLLDPLPPEQREFALEVLACFDEKKTQSMNSSSTN